MSIRDQNDELWNKMAELETTLEMAKAQVHPLTAPLQPPYNPLLLTTFYITFCLLPTAYCQGGIAAAKAKPGGMEEQLEQMATFANNLQVRE